MVDPTLLDHGSSNPSEVDKAKESAHSVEVKGPQDRGPDDPLPSIERPGASHLIVVANRLPVTISKGDDGEYHFKMSSGGLVSALSGCKKQMSFTWIGWPGECACGYYLLGSGSFPFPGVEIPDADKELVTRRLQEEYRCQPVYLSDDLADKYYNGFSNSILWPLFHYRT
jgi:trehalose 6-phosphate synthase